MSHVVFTFFFEIWSSGTETKVSAQTYTGASRSRRTTGTHGTLLTKVRV